MSYCEELPPESDFSSISCDIVLDFATENRQERFGEIKKAAQEKFAGYTLEIVLDADLVD